MITEEGYKWLFEQIREAEVHGGLSHNEAIWYASELFKEKFGQEGE